jgi:sulfur carrier protein
MIKIKVNGEEKELNSGTTIQQLLEEMNIKNNMIVVEKNLEIFPKDQFASYEIKDGDSLEIVGFFGGG